LLRWLLASAGIIAFTALYDPARLFGLFYNAPDIIPRILVLYPILSALPQELIFCSFFFFRYADFFHKPGMMVLASALVFAYAHMLFINPIAPTLGFIAGLIFADTYQKTKSLALVTIEHGLYGNVLFLSGLGWYFYHGAIAP
jgi:membrane protease YdiL (CAAX protease family)